MQPRIEYMKVAPKAMSAMLGLEQYVRQSGLDPSLLELVKLRASQINGCAYCIDIHSKDARTRGESEQRLYRSLYGEKRHSSRSENVPPWLGRKWSLK